MANAQHVRLAKEGPDSMRSHIDSIGDEFEGFDLSDADLTRRNLNGAPLRGANLRGANLSGIDCNAADFTGADLRGAKLISTKLQSADLSGACLAGADLSKVVAAEAKLPGANLTDANLSGAQLNKAILTEAQIVNTNFTGAQLEQVDFREARIEGARFNQANLKHSSFHDAKINDCEFVMADLGQAALSGESEVNRTTFEKANLTNFAAHNTLFERVSFKDAKLHSFNATGATLHGDFSSAELMNAVLVNCDLKGSDFTGANLHETELSKCNLRDAVFTEAKISGTKFRLATNVHLAKDLETTVISESSKYFETAPIPFRLRYGSWERVRTFGRLPLFGASYLVVLGIPVFIYLTVAYNELLTPVLNWSEITSDQGEHDLNALALQIRDNLSLRKPPSQMFYAWLSSIFLAVGSSIYVLRCPGTIKEFSKERWVHEHQKDVLAYLPLSWSDPFWRYASGFCYLTGGLLAIFVIGTKSIRALFYITQNAEGSFWWPPF